MSKYLKDVEEKHFFVIGHNKVKNIEELLAELRTMTDTTFAHYVGEHYNHFLNWINDIIEDKELVEALRHEKSKKATIEKIEKRISELKKEHAATIQPKPSVPELKEAEAKQTEETAVVDTGHQADETQRTEDKHKNCPHYILCMAREFWYGLALGAIIGLILSRIFGIYYG